MRIYPIFQPALPALLIAALLGMTGAAHADINPDDNLQLWNPVNIKGHLHEKVPVHLELQPRSNLAGSETTNPNAFSLLIVRPAIGVQLNKQVSIWQGYGWTPSFNPEYRDEHRLFQQLLIETPLKHLTLTNRSRLEERFIQDTNGEASVRVRHQLRVTVPLDKQKKWNAVIYDEPFFNLNSVPTGPQAGFDQNRIFVGFQRRLNRHATVEAGYINNYVNRRSPVRDRLNHAIVLGLNFNVN